MGEICRPSLSGSRLKRSRICVISSGLDNNKVAGLHPFFKILQRNHDVYLVGTSYTGDVYPPFRGEFGNPVSVPKGRPSVLELASIFHRIRGDLVLCFQYDPPELFAACLYRLLKGVPLVVLVQDWDLGFHRARSLLRALRLYSLRSRLWYEVAERLCRKSDLVVVASIFLQKRLGGIRIPQGVDSVRVHREERVAMRAALGIMDWEIAVMWVGKPRTWKGLDDLIAAVRKANAADPCVRLVAVDSSRPGEVTNKPDITWVGSVPKAQMPVLVEACDIYAVTPNASWVGQTQMPTKIFDGMSAAKPVVVSRVSDLPRIVDGCGLVVEPSDIEGLAAAILRLAADLKLRRKLGKRARRRFEKSFSLDRMEEKFVPAIRALLQPERISRARDTA